MLEVGTKAPAFSLPDQNGTVGNVKAAENPAKMLAEL